MDANKGQSKKVRLELHKKATHWLEIILEVALHKPAALLPLASHLTHHLSKTYKDKLIRNILSWISSHGRTSVPD